MAITAGFAGYWKYHKLFFRARLIAKTASKMGHDENLFLDFILSILYHNRLSKELSFSLRDNQPTILEGKPREKS